MTRRDFARGATLATALSYSRVLGANDRVGIGYIGVGSRGDEVHTAFLEHGDCQTTAVCDLRDDYLDFAVARSRGAPRKYRLYQKLLEDRDVDAVVIATPDHWHALMFVDACRAGKDVYVEKPLSLTVVEGRKMVETAERARRVVQVGTQRRSAQAMQEAAELVRSGAIGRVTVAKFNDVVNEWPNGIGRPPSGPPPDAWEWDQWLGPAPEVPYNPNRTYYNFRWFHDYSAGQVANLGVHLIDMIRWCLNLQAPRMVTALGGRYAVQDNREIPDTMEVIWEFDGPSGPVLVVFSQYNANAAPVNARRAELELRGTKGTMYLDNYNSYEIVPETTTEMVRLARTPLDRVSERTWGASKKPATEPQLRRDPRRDSVLAHARNFLDCVKSRAQCNADILNGHLSTTATLLASIAQRTHSLLEWDAQTERFTNHDSANRHLHYEYRKPYRLA